MVVDLTNLFNEIIKKHTFIKFDQKYSKLKIEFLNVLVHKDEKQRLQKTLFKKKQTQSYLHPKFDNPALLKKSICTVKYCVSKESIQQTVNLSAVIKYCKSNLQKDVMTIFN